MIEKEGNRNSAKLHPKEHGAYAILAIPIITALIAGGVTLVGICIAAAAFAGFLAHEPLLVVAGHRGRRARVASPTAKSRLAVLLLLTLVTGGIAFVAGSGFVRMALLVCLALATSSFALAVVGRHRTLVGQLWGVIGLSSPCVPILLAHSVSVAHALNTWMVWLVGFSATTLAVRSVIAAQKRQPRFRSGMVLCTLTLVVCLGAVFNSVWTLMTLPMLALSWYLLVLPPSAQHLKRVGWTLVAGTMLSALLVVAYT